MAQNGPQDVGPPNASNRHNQEAPIRLVSTPPEDSGDDAAAIAGATVKLWLAMDDALSPIVGRRGMAALYQRSLHLTRQQFPWLPVAEQGPLGACDFGTLRAALAAQSNEHAAAGATALLLAFRELMSTLLGEQLTEQLLRPVLAHPSRGRAAKDNLP